MVGVPLMVMVLLDQVAVTPVGRFVAAPIPVAPAVVWVMDNGVLIHKVGLEDALAVLIGRTAMVPAAFRELQPPVNGME